MHSVAEALQNIAETRPVYNPPPSHASPFDQPPRRKVTQRSFVERPPEDDEVPRNIVRQRALYEEATLRENAEDGGRGVNRGPVKCRLPTEFFWTGVYRYVRRAGVESLPQEALEIVHALVKDTNLLERAFCGAAASIGYDWVSTWNGIGRIILICYLGS